MSNLSQAERDKLPESDFAGPHRSFPILDQEDVHSAAHLIGKADNPDAVKRKIMAIARRKGLKLPDAWVSEARKSMTDLTVATFGCFEVKAIGDGKVEGQLVRFSGPHDPDKSMFRDYFTKSTDFDSEFPARTSIYYHHGLDRRVGKQRIGYGEMSLKSDGSGIWIEGSLDMGNPNAVNAYKRVENGEMGWSTGTLMHLVERKSVGRANEVLRWPLGKDASLTPIPADPANLAYAIKGLTEFGEEELLTGSTFAEDCERALNDLEQLVDRAQAIKSMRDSQDRGLSLAMAERVRSVYNTMGDLLAQAPVQDEVQGFGLADLTIRKLKEGRRKLVGI